MNDILIPQVIVETPAYLRAIADIWDIDTQNEKKILRQLVHQLKKSFKSREAKINGR